MGATPKTVTIVGAPLDLGQGRRGVDMGPSAIRYAGLEERLASFGCRVVDRGNVTTPEPEALAVADEHARFLPEILEACARLARIVGDVVADGAVPLVLGGDHSVALGTLAGLREAAGEPGGVIWIDAHGDLNTPGSSPSGNVHGLESGVLRSPCASIQITPPGSPAAARRPASVPRATEWSPPSTSGTAPSATTSATIAPSREHASRISGRKRARSSRTASASGSGVVTLPRSTT